MQNFIRSCILATLLAVSGTHAVYAQALIDQAIGSAIGGGTEIGSASHTAAPPSVILNYLQQQGYTNIGPINPTPIGTETMVTATSPAGIVVDLTIDPLTGKVISAAPR